MLSTLTAAAVSIRQHDDKEAQHHSEHAETELTTTQEVHHQLGDETTQDVQLQRHWADGTCSLTIPTCHHHPHPVPPLPTHHYPIILEELEEDGNSRDSGISLSEHFEAEAVVSCAEATRVITLRAERAVAHRETESAPPSFGETSFEAMMKAEAETNNNENIQQQAIVHMKKVTTTPPLSPVSIRRQPLVQFEKQPHEAIDASRGNETLEMETFNSTQDEYVTSKEDSLVLPRFPQLSAVERPAISSTAFQSISSATLAKIMRELGVDEFERHFVLVDCRYPYEYHGVHIKTAVNLYHQEEKEELVARLTAFFFPSDAQQAAAMKRRTPIFYCEYSSKRGPRTAHLLRDIDRRINEGFYPYVDYPHLYLLDRGFKPLFESQDNFRDICATSHGGTLPERYVSEHSAEHTHAKKAHNTMVKSQSFMRFASTSQCHEVVHRYRKRGNPKRNITTPISRVGLKATLHPRRLSTESTASDDSFQQPPPPSHHLQDHNDHHPFRKRALTITDSPLEKSGKGGGSSISTDDNSDGEPDTGSPMSIIAEGAEEQPPPLKRATIHETDRLRCPEPARRWLSFDVSSADNSIEESSMKWP